MTRNYKNHGDLDWAQMEFASRSRRKSGWTCDELAAELWTIGSRLREPPTPEFFFEPTDGPPFEVEPHTHDFPFPPGPDTTIDHDHDPVNGQTQATNTRIDRASVPCKVLSLIASEPAGDAFQTTGPVGVQVYSVELYPMGVLSDIYPQWTQVDPEGPPGSSVVVDEIAMQLQIDVDEIIPADTWVLASVITVSELTTTVVTSDGIAGPPITTVELKERGVWIQVPVWLNEV